MDPSDRDQLDAVLEAWRLAPDGEVHTPASAAEIAEAEHALGRPLPVDLRRLYDVGNGLSVLGGNLSIQPLSGEDLGLAGHADRLREWGWPIPPELLVFGDNGSGDLFGLWYPTGTESMAPMPVIMVGQVFEPACMAIAGTTLPRFLRAWSGYYLVQQEAPAGSLDALALPERLRILDDERGLAPYFEWADPDLPDRDPDPYARGVDPEEVRALLSS